MKAIAVTPGQQGSASLRTVEEPEATDGPMLVETIAVGICGTDLEIARGDYGEAPSGDDYLIIGHESLGRVVEDPTGRFRPGQLVVGIVRRPCSHCANCHVGEWDMCRSGDYTERGIKGLHGYCSERYRIDPDFAVLLPDELSSVGVLLEPTTVVAKAWEHAERIGNRALFEPRTALVTGAGPIGLLAALLGVQRGLDVHVLDVVSSGPKPDLVHALGATYHSEKVTDLDISPDIVMECTGVPSVVFDVIERNGRNGVVCLTGVSSTGRSVAVDGGLVNREIVLQNDAIFGSVNANKRHYEHGVAALRQADNDWLRRLITRRVPIDNYDSAFERRSDDIKVIIEVAGAGSS